jgi:Glutathione peroxidase
MYIVIQVVSISMNCAIQYRSILYFQEPGDADQICEFTKKKNVQFDLFEKINVNGDNAHPLWKFLKHKQGGTLVE